MEGYGDRFGNLLVYTKRISTKGCFAVKIWHFVIGMIIWESDFENMFSGNCSAKHMISLGRIIIDGIGPCEIWIICNHIYIYIVLPVVDTLRCCWAINRHKSDHKLNKLVLISKIACYQRFRRTMCWPSGEIQNDPWEYMKLCRTSIFIRSYICISKITSLHTSHGI